MQDEIVEGETIDKGLERGAGRTRAARQIDLARLAPIISAADIGEDVAGPVLDHDDGEAGVIVEIGLLLVCASRSTACCRRGINRRLNARRFEVLARR